MSTRCGLPTRRAVTQRCSASRSSGARTCGCSPATAATSTTSGTTRWPPRSCAARTRTRGSLDIDVTDALDGRRPGRDLHLRGPRRPGRRAAAAADPAPVPARADDRLPARQRARSTTSARRSSMVVARRPLRRRGRRASGSGSTYEPLPAVVGLDGRPRPPSTLVHDDVPGNVAAHMVQEVGDAPAAIDAAPHRARARPARSSAARRRRWRARASTRAGTPTTGRCGSTARPRPRPPSGSRSPRSSSCRSTGSRCITPDVGGGFGVKIMHPWPEEVLVPWAAIRLRPRGQVGRGPARALHLRPRTSAAQQHTVRVGFDDDGRVARAGRAVLARQRRLHAVRHHRRRSSPRPSCSGRTSPAPTGSSSTRSTPTRSSSRPTAAPAGRRAASSMERMMDAIADQLGLDRAEVRRRNMIQPDEMPYDQGLIFQDGRPLIYDSGDFPASLDKLQQARRLGRLRGVPGRGRGRGPPGRHRARPAMWRAPASGRTRARTCGSRPTGDVVVSTGLTTQGQGHQTVVRPDRADELGVPIERRHGHHRRHAAVQLRAWARSPRGRR